MTSDFTLEPWESLLGKLGQTQPDGSKSQSLSLDARYPPPTPKHTLALEISPRSRTHALSQTHSHTKTQMCAAHPPTHTHSQTLEHINTCPHSHTFAKIREDTKLVRMNFHIQLLPCMHASNPRFALSHMHAQIHTLSASLTHILQKSCEILVVFVCVPLCGHSLSLSLFLFSNAP